MKTYSAKPGEVGRKWFVMDAEGEVLGRLATRAATVIRGKHKPPYTPHIDVGDFVVVVNAEKVRLTGNKLDAKKHRRHTGYPGGLVEIPYRRLMETHPERAIEQAVRGMLPKGRLGRQLRHKLKVYKGPDHPHSSQKPEPLSVSGPIPVHVEPEPERKPRPRKEKPKAEKPKAEKPSGPGEKAPRKTSRRKDPKSGGKAASDKPAARKSGARKASARKSGPPSKNRKSKES